jgi:hypothetical protein
MKTISTQLVAAAFTLGIFLTSCGSGELNRKAETAANDFYKDLQNKDYKAAINLCSDKAFATDSKADWQTDLEKNAGLLGDIKSFTKTSGFNVATSTTNGTTVTVAYNVQWQYGKSTDSLFFIKEKDGSMKLYHYQWEYKDAKYLSEVDESEKVTGQYMDAVKSGNVDAAIDLCSDEALKITPKQNWIAFLNTANNKLGSVADYKIIKDSSTYHIDATGDAGKGNYYDVFVQSDRGGNKVMEKIVFFQKNYDVPVKLTGHYFL